MAFLTKKEKRVARNKGKKIANGLIKFLTPSKSSKPKRGYKHNRKSY